MELCTVISHVALKGELAKADSKSAELTKSLMIIFCLVEAVLVSAVCIISYSSISSHTAKSEWLKEDTVTNESLYYVVGFAWNKWHRNEHPSECPEDKTNVNLTLIQHWCRSNSPAVESELCESRCLRGTLLGSLCETLFVSVSSVRSLDTIFSPSVHKKSIRSSVTWKHVLWCLHKPPSLTISNLKTNSVQWWRVIADKPYCRTMGVWE